MIKLKKFQEEASEQITKRYSFFAGHADRPGTRQLASPFFQALSAITGAGKTPSSRRPSLVFVVSYSQNPSCFGCLNPARLWRRRSQISTAENILPSLRVSKIRPN